MSLDLNGKIIMVTGATRGLGRALTKSLVENGCKVYAVGRNEELLKSLKEECTNVTTIQVDVGNWEDVRQKLENIEVLDGLVNNAAVVGQDFMPVVDVTEEILDKNLNVNVKSTINITQIIGRKMVENKRPGSIVNVSSVWSIQATKGYFPYCISKAAVDMVTKQFALELGPHNIRVNSFNPTVFLSDTIKGMIERGIDLKGMFHKITPLSKIAEVEEMVFPILYLLSDKSAMVSGTTHIADGAMISSFPSGM
ncbi:hypothetical protein ACF0H5_022699 [Mactra antiquata]